MRAESAAGWHFTEYHCPVCEHFWYERPDRPACDRKCPGCGSRGQYPRRDIEVWGGYAALLPQLALRREVIE